MAIWQDPSKLEARAICLHTTRVMYGSVMMCTVYERVEVNSFVELGMEKHFVEWEGDTTS